MHSEARVGKVWGVRWGCAGGGDHSSVRDTSLLRTPLVTKRFLILFVCRVTIGSLYLLSQMQEKFLKKKKQLKKNINLRFRSYLKKGTNLDRTCDKRKRTLTPHE